ncbi:MAG: hypothetical protein ACKOSS_00755, partial [Planctomycetia bacterium]
GFWRYLALFPLRWYLVARELEEGKPLKPQDFGGRGAQPKAQLALRTYLWGKCAYDSSSTPPSDPYDRASKLLRVDFKVSNVDVWHSHVLRVDIGHLGGTPHRFIDAICARQLDTAGARELAKRLSRMKNVVMLDSYDVTDGQTLVDGQCPPKKKKAEKKKAKKKKASKSRRRGNLRGSRR